MLLVPRKGTNHNPRPSRNRPRLGRSTGRPDPAGPMTLASNRAQRAAPGAEQLEPALHRAPALTRDRYIFWRTGVRAAVRNGIVISTVRFTSPHPEAEQFVTVAISVSTKCRLLNSATLESARKLTTSMCLFWQPSGLSVDGWPKGPARCRSPHKFALDHRWV
jgi:hypothetical protein